MSYKKFSLIIDTSYNFSFGLFNEHKLIASYQSLKGEDKVSDIMIPQIMQLLEVNNCKMQDISFVGIVNGPGFFTGIRIGIIFAKMVQLALKIPIITYSALAVMSYEVLQSKFNIKQVLACYNMGKSGMVYAIFNNKLQYMQKEQYIAIKDIEILVKSLNHEGLAVVGNKQLLVENTKILPDASFFRKILYPNIQILSILAHKKYINKQYTEEMIPLYAKETDIMIKEV